MARNRQKAKERQARRKQAQGTSSDGQGAPESPKPARATPPPAPAPPSDNGRDDDGVDPGILAGAPADGPAEPPQRDPDLDDPPTAAEQVVPADDVAEDDVAAGAGSHAATAERHGHRSRLVQFLFAVWAELQRVQWPDRQALTTLTGVVLAFLLIAGGYLGLLDAIFSRFIQEIL